MSQVSTWKCTKPLIMNDGITVAFTEGRLYEGWVSATPSGEWAMSFIDDDKEEHLMPSRALHEHFVKVE